MTTDVLRLVSTTIEHFVAMENIDARVYRREIKMVQIQRRFRFPPLCSRIRSFWFPTTANQKLCSLKKKNLGFDSAERQQAGGFEKVASTGKKEIVCSSSSFSFSSIGDPILSGDCVSIFRKWRICLCIFFFLLVKSLDIGSSKKHGETFV